MDVAVGSGNPVKRAAVARALPDAAVTAVSVNSGVREQPIGRAEIVRGARNRAVGALDGYDLGVGIESGVARLDVVDGQWLVMWAAATDGEAWGLGSGPSIRLPEEVARRVGADERSSASRRSSATREDAGEHGSPSSPSHAQEDAGESLGPVMDDLLGESNVGEKQGAAGGLTGGVVDRETALVTAVGGALGPFLTDHY